MNPASIARLVEMLEAETAALRGGDLRRATELAAAKTEEVRAFAAAAGQPPTRELALPLDRLREALAANRDALRDAVALQSRVVETVAQAVNRARASAMPGYGRGIRAGGSLAVSVRA
ncbi:MAG: hypothetical protein K2X11_14275 [Acetobacteraceae bacterium]|nr:hypothetical protein [Acetobacteraceae bacterium]